MVYNQCYLWHLHVNDLQVSGVHLESQTHLLEHAFTQVLPLQQLLFFGPLPAIAANVINIAVVAIKILRFIVLKFKFYYSVNFVCLGHTAILGGRQQSE